MTLRLLATCAALVLAAGACGGDDDATGAGDPAPAVADPTGPAPDPGGEVTGGEVTVEVAAAFEPEALDVPVGTTVTWVNTGEAPHTVTSTDGPVAFDESLPGGGSASVTFDEPGTYAYVCAIHPDMTGEVVVS